MRHVEGLGHADTGTAADFRAKDVVAKFAVAVGTVVLHVPAVASDALWMTEEQQRGQLRHHTAATEAPRPRHKFQFSDGRRFADRARRHLRCSTHVETRFHWLQRKVEVGRQCSEQLLNHDEGDADAQMAWTL